MCGSSVYCDVSVWYVYVGHLCTVMCQCGVCVGHLCTVVCQCGVCVGHLCTVMCQCVLVICVL